MCKEGEFTTKYDDTICLKTKADGFGLNMANCYANEYTAAGCSPLSCNNKQLESKCLVTLAAFSGSPLYPGTTFLTTEKCSANMTKRSFQCSDGFENYIGVNGPIKTKSNPTGAWQQSYWNQMKIDTSQVKLMPLEANDFLGMSPEGNWTLSVKCPNQHPNDYKSNSPEYASTYYGDQSKGQAGVGLDCGTGGFWTQWALILDIANATANSSSLVSANSGIPGQGPDTKWQDARSRIAVQTAYYPAYDTHGISALLPNEKRRRILSGSGWLPACHEWRSAYERPEFMFPIQTNDQGLQSPVTRLPQCQDQSIYLFVQSIYSVEMIICVQTNQNEMNSIYQDLSNISKYTTKRVVMGATQSTFLAACAATMETLKTESFLTENLQVFG